MIFKGRPYMKQSQLFRELASRGYDVVSVRRFRDLRDRGYIPYLKLGTRTFLYNVDDVMRVIESAEVEAVAAIR